MTDLLRDELTLSRVAQAPSPAVHALHEQMRRGKTHPHVSPIHAGDRVSVSPQARMKAGLSHGDTKAKSAPVHAQPRISLERLERIKRFYAAGNMRPNPQAIARHLWHERRGL